MDFDNKIYKGVECVMINCFQETRWVDENVNVGELGYRLWYLGNDCMRNGVIIIKDNFHGIGVLPEKLNLNMSVHMHQNVCFKDCRVIVGKCLVTEHSLLVLDIHIKKLEEE